MQNEELPAEEKQCLEELVAQTIGKISEIIFEQVEYTDVDEVAKAYFYNRILEELEGTLKEDL